MSEKECLLCGRDVEESPPKGCEVCHGNAEVGERAYTLTDVRTGRAPKENRMNPEGGLAPKSSPFVTGA